MTGMIWPPRHVTSGVSHGMNRPIAPSNAVGSFGYARDHSRSARGCPTHEKMYLRPSSQWRMSPRPRTCWSWLGFTRPRQWSRHMPNRGIRSMTSSW